MKRLIIVLLIGVSAIGLMPLSSYAAAAYPMFGPQSPEDDYLYFGDDTYPRQQQHGITFTINEASTSFQSIIGAINLEYVAGSTLIDQRQISYFYVLANNRIVDSFEPVRDQEGKWRTNYQLRIAMEDWNIGSIVNLQIVAVSPREPSTDWVNYDNHYVVAWSGVQGPIQLKPLPVIDREAVTVLEAILAKLEHLRTTLSAQLAQIDQSIRKIYEVTPQTQAKFDAAMANLQAKLPTEQIKNEAEQVQKMVEESGNRIRNTPQQIKFGEINWMGVVTTPALDFTAYEEQLKLIRKILAITLWCEFFYFVILVLRPRLTV